MTYTVLNGLSLHVVQYVKPNFTVMKYRILELTKYIPLSVLPKVSKSAKRPSEQQTRNLELCGYLVPLEILITSQMILPLYKS